MLRLESELGGGTFYQLQLQQHRNCFWLHDSNWLQQPWLDVSFDTDEDGGNPTGNFLVLAGSPGEDEGSN
jgi:hypothetical protein